MYIVILSGAIVIGMPQWILNLDDIMPRVLNYM